MDIFKPKIKMTEGDYFSFFDHDKSPLPVVVWCVDNALVPLDAWRGFLKAFGLEREPIPLGTGVN
jgi:hypothetical protein